ncbi:MAG TPA: SRPBCC family protein [Hyphomicrobium sp.]|nr:SRPBCC family protein [Hyphomicrobium sp.]
MLSKILLIIAAAVAAFLGYVALLPATGVVSRSAVIAAPADAIFPHINSLKQWDAWSPWAKLDPKAKSSLEGPEAGVGSAFRWDGNSEVGTGKMTILESEPNSRVKIKLDFEKPFANTSVADFTLQPEAGGTRVSWTMTGERPFLARAMCTLFRADAMVGSMFEKGLANLAVASGAK